MKKGVFFLFYLIVSHLTFSKTVELAKLSKGKLVKNKTLFDRDKDDIYGYFLIFEKDKIAQEKYLYEYVLLDKNLNKVSNGEFTQTRLLKGSGLPVIFNPVYRNGFITIGIGWNLEFWGYKTYAYRLLDVKENKLSDDFTLLSDLTKKYNPETKGGKNIVTFFYKPNPFGYSLRAAILTDIDKKMKKANWGDHIFEGKHDNGYSRMNKTYFVNEKLEPLWSYSYNEEEPNMREYMVISFLNNDDKHNNNILTAFKSFEEKANYNKIKKGELSGSYLFFDKNNGKLLAEVFPYSKPSKKWEIKDVSIKSSFVDEAKQTVTFISHTMNTWEIFVDENLIWGFSRAEYSLVNGNELNRSYFSWNQLSPYLNINEYGYVKEKGEPECYLYLHDVIMKDDENMIFIMEQYRSYSKFMVINDLFFMELDKEMQVVNFQKIEKQNRVILSNFKMNGSMVNSYGYFDYTGYQDLGNDNYLFFYYNKQKPEGGGKKQWVMGIVSYIDGKFSEQKLPLKSEDDSDMEITPAKKGYIMVYETFKDKDKSAELRLEKINY